MGHDTVVSIFMALSTTMGSPALMSCPGLHATSMTWPAIGAPTLPSSLGLAFSLAMLSASPMATLSSTTSTTLGRPFSSKKTSLHPFACLSPTALKTISALTPLPTSSTIFSSVSSGLRKALVGRMETSLYFFFFS